VALFLIEIAIWRNAMEEFLKYKQAIEDIFHAEPSLRYYLLIFIAFLTASVIFRRSENWEMAGNLLLIPTALSFFIVLASLIPLNLPCQTPLRCILGKLEIEAQKLSRACPPGTEYAGGQCGCFSDACQQSQKAQQRLREMNKPPTPTEVLLREKF
jgi:hypothetical protein